MPTDLESPSLLPPSFLRYALKSKIIKATQNAIANKKLILVDVRDRSGRVRFAAINLNLADDLLIVFELDGEKIINHTINDLTSTGAGKLAIGEKDLTAGFVSVVSVAASNKAVVFDFSSLPLQFQHKCIIYIENTSTTNRTLQAAYILYDVFKG